MSGEDLKRLFSLILLMIFPLILNSQSRYWVVFKDKDGVNFNPYTYFDKRTIEKREAAGISLIQYSDLPIKEEYCREIEKYGSISTKSRWMNAVALSLPEKQAGKIQDLDFVSNIWKIELVSKPAGINNIFVDSSEMELLRRQLQVFGLEYFENNRIDGKGVRIAVFDNGFPGVDSLEAFQHIFEDGRLIATRNFVNDNEFVYDFNNHGTNVLGCIAGYYDGKKFGLATGAEFLLARTEINIEVFAEEEYWAAAMEWADKNGADIINSSLGYTFHRYFPRQMDGKSVFVSRMANIAARKGILVINAAGNDGDSDWQVISAPADADSVLSVGGISGSEGTHISFSSFGPTYDGRLKPNVVALGEVITPGKKGGVKKAYGTSFASPLVTGFAACVMQMNPEWNNMKVFREIEKSGHLYPYYDYAHGYGVPQASYFFGTQKKKEPTFSFNKKVNFLEIEIIKTTSQDNTDSLIYGSDHNYLYYHIASAETGKIRKYRVIKMTEADSYSVSLDEIRDGEYVRAHYAGFSKSFKF